MTIHNEFIEPSELAPQIQLLKSIQAAHHYQAKQLTPAELTRQAFNKISLFARAIDSVDHLQQFDSLQSVGSAVISIGEQANEFHESGHNADLAQGFHFASFGMNALRFVSIPLMYLAAYGFKKKVPFTLSNNMRWAYSSGVLALAITAMTVPVAAPIIAFIMASIGVVSSSFFLGKLIYARYQLAKEERDLHGEIKAAEDKIQAMQQQARHLEHGLHEVSEALHLISLSQEIAHLAEQYTSHKKHLEVLYDKREHNQQLQQELRSNSVLARVFSVFLACAAISGLAVSLFFPPIGLALLAAVAVTGAAYALGQVVLPFFRSLQQWLVNKFSSSTKEEALADEESNADHLVAEHVLSQEQRAAPVEQQEEVVDEVLANMHESTLDVLLGLSENKHLTPVLNFDQADEDRTALLTSKASFSVSLPVDESEEDESESESESESLVNH